MSRPKIKSAAYRLFYFRYQVQFPQMFLYEQEYLKKVGRHVSGDPVLDQQRIYQKTISMQPPAGMALLMNQGATIDFQSSQDVVDIYEDLQEHFQDWERRTLEGIHPDLAPPIEDLRMLESLAVTLYETAMHYQPNEHTGSKLRQRLLEMNRSRNPVNYRRIMRDRIYDDKEELKPYESIVDRIERELLEGIKWL